MKIKNQYKRFLYIFLAILIFLPPIAFFPRFFGISSLCGSPLCMRMLIKLEGIPAAIKNLYVGFIMLVLIFGVTLVLGRLFCSHVCPVGGFPEMVNKLIPKKWQINYTWIPSPAVRYSYLAAFLIIPVLGVGSICCNYCNFALVSSIFEATTNPAGFFLNFNFTGIVNMVLLFLLGFFALGGRAYCNFLCPIGAVDGIVNWLGAKIPIFKRVSIDAHKCNNCGDCLAKCPVWAIEHKENTTEINQLSCFTCKDCISACKRKAISYRSQLAG